MNITAEQPKDKGLAKENTLVNPFNTLLELRQAITDPKYSKEQRENFLEIFQKIILNNPNTKEGL